MAAQIACLNQLPRMAADRNSTYTTSFDFHCILQAKNARLLFACSCELARVYMRPSPTSRSRVHATFVSRVHATPRPSIYLVAAFSHPWSQRVTQPHGNTTIASSHPFSSRTPWRHHFQVEPKIMFKFKDFMWTPHPGAVFFPVVSNTLKCRTPWDTVSKHISGKMPFVSRSHWDTTFTWTPKLCSNSSISCKHQ